MNSNFITSLFSGSLDIGTYSYVWDVSSIESGVYYCNITTNKNNSTIKIIVNK
jgi:hypothetical protein